MSYLGVTPCSIHQCCSAVSLMINAAEQTQARPNFVLALHAVPACV